MTVSTLQHSGWSLSCAAVDFTAPCDTQLQRVSFVPQEAFLEGQHCISHGTDRTVILMHVCRT
jgi:hypothetical protein